MSNTTSFFAEQGVHTVFSVVSKFVSLLLVAPVKCSGFDIFLIKPGRIFVVLRDDTLNRGKVIKGLSKNRVEVLDIVFDVRNSLKIGQGLREG